MTEKAPFERVFSLIERKKLLQRAAKEKVRIILKNSSGKISEFKIQSHDSDCNLEGQVIGNDLKDYEKVTALFYVDSERYFLTTRIKKKTGFFQLLNDPQFFKFNRRAAFRVKVPTSIELSYHVQSIRNIEVNKKISVLEFSSTGARLFWPGDSKLSKNTIIRGLMQWGKGKTLPVDCSIVHTPEKGVYGVRFVNLQTVTQSRLKMLSVEIQQTIHFK